MAKNQKTAETVEPNPADIMESLRDFGYTLPTAISDLIDNSLTAGSRNIHVTVESSDSGPYVSVVDDGSGMQAARLVEAMRMGTSGPLAGRNPNDLGRFGLGLKTASLSIGRCLTVITKTGAEKDPSIRRWDIGHIRQTGKWSLLAEPTTVAASFLEGIRKRKSGTAVIIEDLDRAAFLKVPQNTRDSHLADALKGLGAHLGMVFHRFIEDGICIRLGCTAVRAWDPFLQGNSTVLPTETIPHLGSQITVTPFVLPHHSRLTDEVFENAGGIRGWNAHQGFYVYRCKRLIASGTWLNLGLKKEEHFKLARIRMDLPNTLDSEWKLDVMKSRIAAPPALRDTFARIARKVRGEASNVYRHRGERVVSPPGDPPRGLWQRLDARRTVRFRLDRTHPVLYALLNSGDPSAKPFADVLSLIEQSLPIDSILQVPSRSLEGTVSAEDSLDIARLSEVARVTEQFFIGAGYKPAEAREHVLALDPLFAHREAIARHLQANPVSPEG